MKGTHLVVRLLVALAVTAGSTAYAQSDPPSRSPWSVDFGIGLDNSISGNINSSGIGIINNQTAVILSNKYEDVYGTGLHFRFGAGYMVDDETEIRVTFTLQSLDAELVEMGEIGGSRLYGQYDDYQSFGLDVALRRYLDLTPTIRIYGEGSIGLGFIDETDVMLVAPQANLSGNATDFYDQTAAFALAGNVGLLFQTSDQVGFFAQAGLRWVSGMSSIDGLEGTGLETINDKSGRWTLPIIGGVRVRF